MEEASSAAQKIQDHLVELEALYWALRDRIDLKILDEDLDHGVDQTIREDILAATRILMHRHQVRNALGLTDEG